MSLLKKTKSKLFTPDFSIRNVILSLILGFAIAYIVLIAVFSFGDANHIIKSLFEQDFLNATSAARMIDKIVVLGLAGLAVGFGMKAGILNIGVSGQMTAGGFLAYLLINKSNFLTSDNHSLVMFVSFLIVIFTSVALALLSGILKAFFKVNEVISTIMLNWVVVYLVKRYATTSKGDAMWANGSDTIFVQGNTWIYAGIAIALFIVSAIALYIYLNKTKAGFKLIATGKNKDAAAYAGFNAKFQQLVAFAISGFMAGLAGYVLFFLSYNSIPAIEAPIQDGFIAIAVSLAAMNNPLMMVPSAIIFGLLNGPVDGVVVAGMAPDVILIFSGVITYFVAISNMFMYFKPMHYIKNNLLHRTKENAPASSIKGGE